MQQNFDEDLISQRIPIAEVTSRLQNMSLSPRPNIDFKKLLYNASKSNKKLHKGRTHSIIQSSARHQKEKEEKIKQMKKAEETNQMKECTFKPSINKSKSKKRTLKQFLDFQESFINRAQTKREILQKKMKENNPTYSFQPKINANKIETSNIPTFERLYNISKYSLTERETTEPDFTPAITSRGKRIVRNAPFHQHLYTDALRRQRQQMHRQEQSYSPEPNKQTHNEKNDQLVAHKIIKQYYNWLKQLNIKDRLSFEQFVIVFYKMGFIASNLDEDGQGMTLKQKKLLLQAYQTLRLPTVRNVCVFILALTGIYNINPINFTEQQSSRKLFQLNFDKQSGRKLQASFETLFRNRLFNQSKSASVFEASQPSFKPTISLRSEALASIHRSRMLQMTSTMLESTEIEFPKQGTTITISHADLLHLNKLGKDVANMKKKELMEKQQIKKCSFQPNSSKQRLVNNNVGIKKCEELFQKSRFIVKQDKSVIDRQFQQSKKECTFKPTINKAPQRLVTVEEPAPDFNKTVARLFEGRRLKQQKHSRVLTTEPARTPRRTHNTTPQKQPLSQRKNLSKIASSKQQINEGNQYEQQPFLVIDVNLGETIQQIIINKRDLHEGKRLAEQFSDKHHLDNASRQKLVQMLGMEIYNVLNEITEEDQNYWSNDS